MRARPPEKTPPAPLRVANKATCWLTQSSVSPAEAFCDGHWLLSVTLSVAMRGSYAAGQLTCRYGKHRCSAPRQVARVLGVYYGKLIGKIETYAHSFSGTVYAASDKSIIITNLVYDGAGPAAFFWGSTKGAALTLDGEQLPDENGSTDLLKAYRNAKVQLKLPRKITAYKSIGMYCKAFETDSQRVERVEGQTHTDASNRSSAFTP
ncbi:hypothetical protein HPB51_003771 [Rhipicephalus microplus]|uniref:DM13 domain-containing protein n=1 Tax=Rhipicephalus microplus TaxID=6941 RepID=A0A9J6DZU8_RHIMP|nr:hypothetical protein HPB51_003771 [Rhipicephalus microplus]